MPKIFDDSQGQVGAVMQSILTEPQVQAAYGIGWILSDGRNVSGSKYATMSGNNLVPDLRGMVLRGKNNGRSDGNQNPDGDSGLGAFQDHGFNSHNHGGGTHAHGVTDSGHKHLTMANAVVNSPPSGATQIAVNQAFGQIGTCNTGAGLGLTSNDVGNITINGSGAILSTDGVNETRMRNVTVNHFIKIN